MAKTLVSENALLDWMNGILREHEECNDCRFTSVTKLAQTDDDGCNWSSSNLQCSGVPAEVCSPIASVVVRNARELFNLV